MPKDSPYFQHDADARNDPKLVALKAKYGMAGIGQWWVMVEILRSQDGYRLPMKPYVARMLASEWLLGEEEAKRFLTDLTSEFDLIHSDGDWLWSERLARRMSWLDSLRNKRVEGGYTGAVRKWLPAPDEEIREETLSPIAVDPVEVKKIMDSAGRRCTEMDSRIIAEALGQRGGTADALFYALKQIRGPVRSPVGYILSMIRQDIVLRWNASGRPEAPRLPDPNDPGCLECGLHDGKHVKGCSLANGGTR